MYVCMYTHARGPIAITWEEITLIECAHEDVFFLCVGDICIQFVRNRGEENVGVDVREL